MKRFGQPAGLSLAGLLLLLVSACGGKSTVGQPNDPDAGTFAFAMTNLQTAISSDGIADLDRAFAFCLGPADPHPLSTPAPDPSGHSRAQVPCLDAGKQVVAALPAYQEAISAFQSSLGTREIKDKQLAGAFAAVLKLHQTRLQLYDDIATAVGRGDLETLANLRQSYKEIAVLTDASQKAVTTLAPTPKK